MAGIILLVFRKLTHFGNDVFHSNAGFCVIVLLEADGLTLLWSVTVSICSQLATLTVIPSISSWYCRSSISDPGLSVMPD